MINSYDRGAPVPDIGSTWLWEPTKPYAYDRITVIEIRENEDSVWVLTRNTAGEDYFNSLDRFWQAVVSDTPTARARADALRHAPYKAILGKLMPKERGD